MKTVKILIPIEGRNKLQAVVCIWMKNRGGFGFGEIKGGRHGSGLCSNLPGDFEAVKTIANTVKLFGVSLAELKGH